MGEPFSKKIFSWQMGGQVLGAILWGAVLYGTLMIRSCQERGSFTNAFSCNLKTLNMKIFPNHEGVYT